MSDISEPEININDDSNCFTTEELNAILLAEGSIRSTTRTVKKCNQAGTASDNVNLLVDPAELHNEVVEGQIAKENLRKRRVSGKTETKIRFVNRMKRMHGKEYVGFLTRKNQVTGRKNTFQNVTRKERKMGLTCKSVACFKSKRRNCPLFSNETRSAIFKEFWETYDWGQKEAFVRSLVDMTDPKRRRATSVSRREETFHFFLKVNGERKQVCREMFLNTLGLGREQVRNWLLQKKAIKTKQVASTKGGDKLFLQKFLEDIPKLESHYCRKDTNKLYLDPIFRSKYQFYEAYKNRCSELNAQAVCKSTFMKLLEQKNIAIHQPKKDMCDVCSAHDVGNVTDEEWVAHKERKNAARAEKGKDKAAALRGEIHVITMDVQKVLLSPMLTASALYYKTKLVVHNFTVFDLASLDTTCFLWDETEADLVASTFATCLIKYFDDNFNDDLPIVVYSDGCTSQNRNAILSNALLSYAARNGKIVVQKYLEKGHTQMEVDSVHSQIERRIKGRVINLPTDYIQICQDARQNPKPYKVVYMNHKDFTDYSTCKLVKSIRPRSKNGEHPHVTDLRHIRCNANGTMDYKLGYDEDWKVLSKQTTDGSTNFPKLYKKRLPITKRKFEDLMELLHVIPPACHMFYKSLPYKK